MKNFYSYINGKQQKKTFNTFEKYSPITGKKISQIKEISTAVLKKNLNKFRQKLDISFPNRSKIISEIIYQMKLNKKLIIKIMMEETGRKKTDCEAELNAAITCAEFYLGEGYRLYSNVRKSFDKDKLVFTTREPCGVALLIVASNTPMANLAWKFFPAFICGNKIILKGSEDVPALNDLFYKILIKSGVSSKDLILAQGSGKTIGDTLVKSLDYDVLSYTGNSIVGSLINQVCAPQLKKVSLELGGKNCIFIDKSAEISNAINHCISSSFSNAGQRCASSSKILVHRSIYSKFKKKLLNKVANLKVGNSPNDFLGPVINKNLFDRHRTILNKYKNKIIFGKKNFYKHNHNGFFIYPTLLEGVNQNDDIYEEEIFGPIAILCEVYNMNEAINIINNSIYGLTCSIHTQEIKNMNFFIKNVQTGICNVNTGTHGSEPHFPFGGLKLSGNGTREPGENAIDIYTNFKNVSIK